MRNAFLALVLANLAFAAWHHWFFQPPPPLQRATDIPTIRLASELRDGNLSGAAAAALEEADSGQGDAEQRDAEASEEGANGEPGASRSIDAAGPDESSEPQSSDAAEPESAAAPLQATAVPAQGRCVSVGPFRELSQAAGAAASLRAGGYDPTQRAREGEIWVGYWVYLDRIATVPEANEVVARLRDNGITDSYVIANSDSGNLVSLGVFTEITRAGGRREEARRLGFEPVIVDRTRPGTVYWVDVTLDGRSLDFELLQSPGRILRLEQRPCEPAA
jgi:hypothetical protein